MRKIYLDNIRWCTIILDEGNGKRLKKGGKPSPDNDIQLMVYSIRE